MKFLSAGDVIELKNGMKVYADVPKHLVFANCEGDFSLSHHDIEIGKYGYKEGRFIVTHTTFDGGGTGMGVNDVYPNGHHVWCVKAYNPKVKVDFYQSGCFTAMIRGIEPIGKATQVWTIEKTEKEE